MRTPPDVATRPDFPHGTDRGYCRGCHCIGCRRAHNRAKIRREMRVARGLHYLVDAEPVRQHVIRLLSEANLDYGETTVIARAANVSVDLVQYLRERRHMMMTHDRATRLLALTAADLTAVATWVPAKIPVQQFRSLQALGWPGPILAERLGYPGQASAPWLSQKRDVVHRRTAERMQALYDELGGTLGPSEASRRIARQRGWGTPLAYDENGDLIPGALRGKPGSMADKRSTREEVIEMLREDLDTPEIAERTGLSQRAVLRVKAALREAEPEAVAS